jgi:hypothetical protein
MDDTAIFFQLGVHSIPQSIAMPSATGQQCHLSQIIPPGYAQDDHASETTIEQAKAL